MRHVVQARPVARLPIRVQTTSPFGSLVSARCPSETAAACGAGALGSAVPDGCAVGCRCAHGFDHQRRQAGSNGLTPQPRQSPAAQLSRSRDELGTLSSAAAESEVKSKAPSVCRSPRGDAWLNERQWVADAPRRNVLQIANARTHLERHDLVTRTCDGVAPATNRLQLKCAHRLEGALRDALVAEEYG